MKQIVAVDPGLNGCGVSVFNENARLTAAAYVPNARKDADLPTRWEGAAMAISEWLGPMYENPLDVRTLIVEMPRVYPAARQKGDQNDLMNLVGVVAAVTTLLISSGRRIVYPRDWKGTLDPDEMILRVQRRLSATERAIVTLPGAASLQHNVWDAVGIGLWSVGRLEDRMVVAR
jgi:hypothetical protein